jgi:hypothetical protein
MAKIDELSLDHRFKQYLDSNVAFQNWIISKTRFKNRRIELVIEKIWHQRWYRDPVTKKDSETDIFLVFKDKDCGSRIALHIENKLANSVWQAYQAENYKIRAEARKSSYNYVDFQTVLMAPKDFISAWPAQVAHFDVVITHEALSEFIPEFLTGC